VIADYVVHWLVLMNVKTYLQPTVASVAEGGTSSSMSRTVFVLYPLGVNRFVSARRIIASVFAF